MDPAGTNQPHPPAEPHWTHLVLCQVLRGHVLLAVRALQGAVPAVLAQVRLFVAQAADLVQLWVRGSWVRG